MLFFNVLNVSSFVFGKSDVSFFCVAGLVAGFGLNRFGALGSIEIDNGFAGRAKAEGAVCGAGDGEGKGEAEDGGDFRNPLSKFGSTCKIWKTLRDTPPLVLGNFR